MRPAARQQIALVDLLDRLLGTGVVLSGDIVISLSGVDLVQISLRALITSVRCRDRDRHRLTGDVMAERRSLPQRLETDPRACSATWSSWS